MNPKTLLLKLSCLLSILFIFQNCASDKPGTWKNDEIRSGKREDFHALNDQVLKGLAANNAKQLESVMSQEFISDSYKLRQVELISNRLKESPDTLLDEYYVINDKRGKRTIEVNNEGINNHTITYDAVQPEMYLAFFVAKNGANKYMISATYCKYDYGWKLSALDLDPYAENGKTAPELLQKAKDDYAKKYLVNASDYALDAKECLRPYWGWKYNIEPEWRAFSAKVLNEANKKYRFPLTIKQVTTQPRIFSIDNQRKPDGVFPMIYYLTDIKLSDTNAVKKENLNIQKVIGQVIPGIDKDNKCILFAAFNEWPESRRSVDRYEMTDKLSK